MARPSIAVAPWEDWRCSRIPSTIPGYAVHAPRIADESIIEVRPPWRTRRRISYPEAEGGKALKVGSHAATTFFGGAGQFVQYACDFT